MAKDYFTKNSVAFEEYNVENDEKALEEMVKKSGQMGVPVLDIDGEILAGIGIPRSRVMGEILNEMMEMVISYPELNKREILIQMAKDFWVQGQ